MDTHGLGPWYVALLFNENDHLATKHKGSKRKSEILIHTYVHRLAAIRNGLNENDNWLTMQVVGPFLKYSEAVVFYTLWARRVRSKSAKLQRGLDLLAKYHEKYGLKMWAQPQKLDDNKIERKRARTLINYADEDIQTVRDMKKRRKMK